MIRQISIRDFRNLEDVLLDLDRDPVTFLYGRNEAGKSSVLDAIRWCLTGRTRGLDAAGRGAGKLVRQGAKTAHVILQCATWAVGRTVTAGGRTELYIYRSADALDGGAPDLDGPDAQEALTAYLGIHPDLIDAALDGDQVLSADHATAKTILLRLLNVTITDPADGQTYTIDALDTAEARAREDRLQVKRDIAALGTPAKPRVRTMATEEELRAKLDGARARLEQAQQTTAAASGERSALMRQRAELIGSTGSWSIERLEGAIASCAITIERAIAAEGEAPSAELMASLDKEIADTAGRVAMVEGQLKALGAYAGGVCVLGAGITCGTAADQFERARGTLVEERAGLTGTLTGLRARLAELRALAADVANAQRERVAAEREQHRLEGRLAKARELVQVQQRLDALESPQSDNTGPIRTEIADLERQLEQLLVTRRDEERYRQDLARLQGLQDRLRDAEARCERFGPKGLRVAALGGAVAGWLEHVNQITHRLSGGRHQLDISLDPWKLTVDGRDPVLLSVSSRLRVAMAIQAAMGLRVVLVDAADLLDQENTRAFAGTLFSMAQQGMQVIVAATREPKDITGRALTAPHWAAAYWLADGQAMPLERQPATA